jgi:hypothetical protein
MLFASNSYLSWSMISASCYLLFWVEPQFGRSHNIDRLSNAEVASFLVILHASARFHCLMNEWGAVYLIGILRPTGLLELLSRDPTSARFGCLMNSWTSVTVGIRPLYRRELELLSGRGSCICEIWVPHELISYCCRNPPTHTEGIRTAVWWSIGKHMNSSCAYICD